MTDPEVKKIEEALGNTEMRDAKLKAAIDATLKADQEKPLRKKSLVLYEYNEKARQVGDLEYRRKLMEAQVFELHIQMNRLDQEPTVDDTVAPALAAVPDVASSDMHASVTEGTSA